MALRFDIISIFPGMFRGVVGESIVGRAASEGLVEFEFISPAEGPRL